MGSPAERKEALREAATDDSPRFPEDDLCVDFGTKAPGSGSATPADITLAYEQRILCSAEAQAAGAQRALQTEERLLARIRQLEEALGELVRLKDGPRDHEYVVAKVIAWDQARAALNPDPPE